MRADVHLAALKAAAKVAFSVVLLNGCGGTADGTGSGTNAASKANGSSSGSPAPSAADNGTQPPASSKPPTTEPPPLSSADAGPPQNCDELLTSTFPTAETDPYQWTPVAHSKEVVGCCLAELKKNDTGSKYRWDCCVAYDPQETPTGPGIGHRDDLIGACTAWGPPVPPSMKRARRSTPEIAAWIAMAGQAVA